MRRSGGTRFAGALVAALLVSHPGSAAAADGCGSGARCPVDGGYYLAEAPPEWDGREPLPLVVFFHGWNTSPEGMLRNRALVRGVTRRGALLVLPWAQTGYWRQIGVGRAEGGRDELAYIRAVLADVAKHWPLDPARSMASGFSRGASMVWNVACYAGPLFHAYLPIAGGFWHSNPRDCPGGPVNLRHIHGRADKVVALDTVGVYDSMAVPGGIAVLRAANGCEAAAGERRRHASYTCEVWDGCASGRRLELCLHAGGHSIPAEWVGQGYEWMLDLPR